MINVKDLKELVGIQECLEFYGVKIGKNRFAYCPFHNEKHPSLYIYPKDNMFVCFSCGTRGDVVQFVQTYFGITFKEALNKIDKDFSLNLNKKTYKNEPEVEKTIKNVQNCLKEEKRKLYDEYCERLRVLNKVLLIVEKTDIASALKLKEEISSIERILDKEL